MKELLTVENIIRLTQSAFIVRTDRSGLRFRAGQNVTLGVEGDHEKRDYSIYSGEEDEFLEFLVKEVDQGIVSRKLKGLRPGDRIEMEGPYGFFTLKNGDVKTRRFLFFATGTGIAPFHSFVLSNSGLSYTLLHGVRYGYEAYQKEDYRSGSYIACTSRDRNGDHHGRVTGFIREHPVPPDMLCYLCGNVDMIYDVYEILKQQGVPSENLQAEVYF